MDDETIDRALAEAILRAAPKPSEDLRARVLARLEAPEPPPSLDARSVNETHVRRCGALRREPSGTWWFGDLLLGRDDRPRAGLTAFEHGAALVMIHFCDALEQAIVALSVADQHEQAAALSTVLDRFWVWDRTGVWPAEPAPSDVTTFEIDDVPTTVLSRLAVQLPENRPDVLLAEIYVLVERLLVATRMTELHTLMVELAAWQQRARSLPSPPTHWAPRTNARWPTLVSSVRRLLGAWGWLRSRS